VASTGILIALIRLVAAATIAPATLMPMPANHHSGRSASCPGICAPRVSHPYLSIAALRNYH